MAALLEIKNIETYYGLIYAIRGTSLTVDEGTITDILGTNGAGKSTILKTAMGLIDDQPDKGSIEFKGRRIDGKDTEKIVRMGISYVPEGREVFEELSVRENLLMGAYTRKDRHNIAKDFERVYSYFPVLKERHIQWAGTLSGGEQQMLAIGRALMSRPQLLLLLEGSVARADCAGESASPLAIRREPGCGHAARIKACMRSRGSRAERLAQPGAISAD